MQKQNLETKKKVKLVRNMMIAGNYVGEGSVIELDKADASRFIHSGRVVESSEPLGLKVAVKAKPKAPVAAKVEVQK